MGKQVKLNAALVSAIAMANGLRATQVELNEKRVTVTGAFIDLAIEVGSDAFNVECERVFDAIRDNVSGVAVKTGCKLAKDGKHYVVPGNASNARSIINAAFELGVDLMQESASGDVARPYGEIRDEVRARQAALAKAERTDAQVERDDMVATLRKLADALESVKDPSAEMVSAFAHLTEGAEAFADAIAPKAPAKGKGKAAPATVVPVAKTAKALKVKAADASSDDAAKAEPKAAPVVTRKGRKAAAKAAEASSVAKAA